MKMITMLSLLFACAIALADGSTVGSWSGEATMGNSESHCKFNVLELHIVLQGTSLTIANGKADCLDASGNLVGALDPVSSTFEVKEGKIFLNQVESGEISGTAIILRHTPGGYGFNDSFILKAGKLQIHRQVIENIFIDGALQPRRDNGYFRFRRRR